ncbi:MAG: hypothetical protein ACHQPI_06850 [Thermoanaerobaculia bacterium]
MRRILSVVTLFTLVVVAIGATAQQPTQISPKLREVIDQMKVYAAGKPGLSNRIPQGSFYYKWIQNPPPGYEKAYFKFAELTKGEKFLTLSLSRRTPAGVELVMLNDKDMNGAVEDAYKATGRTLTDADRAINTSPDKLKIPVTPEMQSTWNAMLDELKWELHSN